MNHQAIEACLAARDRLDERRLRRQLGVFVEDHEQHILDLAQHLSGMGHGVPDGPGLRLYLVAGKARLAATVAESDILAATIANEIEIASAYAVMAERVDVTGGLARELYLARDDETRHQNWLRRYAARTARAHAPEASLPAATRADAPARPDRGRASP